MKLFDSHAHLDIKGASSKQIDDLLIRAFQNNLVGLIAVAGSTKVGEFDDTLNLAARDPRIFAATGIHPHTASFATKRALNKLRFALDHHRVVALGEIGLDYHYNHSTPTEQRHAFISQIRMAHEVQRPIVIHTREAADDTLAVLKDEGASELGGVVHCFSSDRLFASEALSMDLYLSFSGIVTFPKATEIQEVAATAPANRILAETDTPFLAPIPKRGKTNEPANVRYVVEKIAEIRGSDSEEMAETILTNTTRCFHLELPDEHGSP